MLSSSTRAPLVLLLAVIALAANAIAAPVPEPVYRAGNANHAVPKLRPQDVGEVDHHGKIPAQHGTGHCISCYMRDPGGKNIHKLNVNRLGSGFTGHQDKPNHFALQSTEPMSPNTYHGRVNNLFDGPMQPNHKPRRPERRSAVADFAEEHDDDTE